MDDATVQTHISVQNAGLGERIKEARLARGLSQTEFGSLGDVGVTTQQKYEKGLTTPTAEYFYRLRLHGFDVAALLTGDAQGQTFTSHLRAELSRQSDREQQIEQQGLVEVDEVDLAYGLGGTFADGIVKVQTHLFPRRLLETMTSAPASELTIARGMGDSMQPTIQDGDMVLIDRSQRTVRDQDAIWALTVGDIAMIKRLRVRSGRVQLLSDNSRVPPDEALPDETNIVGRVVFIGRRI